MRRSALPFFSVQAKFEVDGYLLIFQLPTCFNQLVRWYRVNLSKFVRLHNTIKYLIYFCKYTSWLFFKVTNLFGFQRGSLQATTGHACRCLHSFCFRLPIL